MTAFRWAIYLGISWTWCIGMFLPVLLIRDFGLWAFVVFAIPNVIGAAAMGWTIPDSGASRRMVDQHRGAMVIFSQVTLVFQAFFAGWMLPQLLGWWTFGLYAVLVIMLIVAVRRDRDFSLITSATWLISLACAAILLLRGDLSLPPARDIQGATALAPVCLLGFLLCPYLDLTFHRALQKAYDADPGGQGAKRAAFGFGFVVVFGSMILLTLAYSGIILGTARAARAIVGIHMLVQLAATIVLHQVEASRAALSTRDTPPATDKPNRQALPMWPMVLLPSAIGSLTLALPTLAGWQPGEWIYRSFYAFYGLIVPAYVLMRLLKRRPASPLALTCTILLALPFYALGFFSLQPRWLIVGVAVVLLAWLTSAWANRSTPLVAEQHA